LTAGYDSLSIDKNQGYPDLAIARQGDLQGLLDAQTGKVVLPVEYSGVDTDTLTRFGLIEVRTSLASPRSSCGAISPMFRSLRRRRSSCPAIW
jgi:hypothetical protein